MKTSLMICLSAVLLLNAVTSHAEQPINKQNTNKENIDKKPANKDLQKPSGETCKRPPEPPKDKNGAPCRRQKSIKRVIHQRGSLPMTVNTTAHPLPIKNINSEMVYLSA
ncbi:Uncharacterised protein [Yersinia frederiksenii]|nr:Uncharacterised protein [Yersinia frederiksenii]